MKKNNYSKSERILRDKLAKALIENRALMKDKKQLNELKENLRFFHHEMKGGPLSATTSMIEKINQDYYFFDEDEKREIINFSYEGLQKAQSLINFIHPDIAKMDEKINLEELIKGVLLTQDKSIKENKLGLNFRYQQPYNFPINIYGNKAIFTGIINTLTGNSINWSPEYSRIEQAIRIDKGNNLEILIENKKSQKSREISGEKKGIGQNAVKRFLKTMKGEFHNYFNKSEVFENSEKNKYQEMRKFGNSRATNQIKENDEIYGVKIRIPIENLKKY